MMVRQEEKTDRETVYKLITEAFASADHADGNEQDLVEALRKSDAFVPELSLVAEEDGEIVGHILFTKALLGECVVLALAPLSVRPDHQKQGVGTALIKEGHKIAKELGFGYVLVLGSEQYYPRFGYRPAKEFGIEIPKGFPEEYFMAIRLQPDADPVSGHVSYAKEFGL